jgi:hypothetical protein
MHARDGARLGEAPNCFGIHVILSLPWQQPSTSFVSKDKKHRLGTEPMQLLAPCFLQLFSTEYHLFISITRVAAAPNMIYSQIGLISMQLRSQNTLFFPSLAAHVLRKNMASTEYTCYSRTAGSNKFYP